MVFNFSPYTPVKLTRLFLEVKKHFLMLAVGEPNIHQSQTLSEQFSIDQDSITPDISQNPVVTISFFLVIFQANPFPFNQLLIISLCFCARISVPLVSTDFRT